MENKFKIFVIVAIVFLAAAIAGSTYIMLSVINSKETVVEGQVEDVQYDLIATPLGEAITANVYEEGGKQHIARVQLSFGVDQSDKKAYTAFTEKYNANLAVVRNEVILTIREQTYSMMIKPDAQSSLSDEITARVNAVLDTTIIKEVYFEDFFVQ